VKKARTVIPDFSTEVMLEDLDRAIGGMICRKASLVSVLHDERS
jgi:hypothetical protein